MVALIGDHQRLGVALDARAGGRVAGVADRRQPLEILEVILGEDLRDEAHPAAHRDVAPVGRGDAGRLLSAVLERMDTEEGKPSDVLARSEDAKDSALLAQIRHLARSQ
ncbi:hypothetical protein [Undibacterium luofuense]|uniref:hypothetical protein n=1 Tax=Undibacterium luofuense TaxID=2828733 RepID=UPI0030EEF78A